MTRTRHIIRREQTADAHSALPDELHPVLRRVYESRGVNSATLDLSLSNLLPVSKLDAADDAAERLLLAREAQQKVLVLGDFDVDGATATTRKGDTRSGRAAFDPLGQIVRSYP